MTRPFPRVGLTALFRPVAIALDRRPAPTRVVSAGWHVVIAPGADVDPPGDVR
jgi:hypothetical protein